MLVSVLMILLLATKTLKIMSKKVILRYALNVLKYVVTLALGYLGGSSDLI